MASPFTNFIAPSMAPKNWFSLSRLRRRWRASDGSMSPARNSASMLICRPGRASSTKRAATSATRSAPLVITTNCTIVMIRKMTRPTTRLPPVTNSPKVWTMSPPSASVRIVRVVEMEIASLKVVAIRITAGKVEKLVGRSI